MLCASVFAHCSSPSQFDLEECNVLLDIRVPNCVFTLKQKLAQAPILAYPWFDSEAAPFILQTDASAVGMETRWAHSRLCQLHTNKE